ncbi:MAG: MCE family protein [Gammaproteobacteria bacterium]|nr:MCE family protein [Gammaproteobacteria bacterium]
MSQPRKPFLIGVFIFAGIALFVAGLLIMARDNVFSRPVEYVVYFTGALDGLDVGADVTYRGVKVGSVQDIRLSYDPKLKDVIMPVVIRITTDHGRKKHAGAQLNSSITQLIERGLRAQLQTPSFLTGKAIVALDIFPDQVGYVRDPSVVDLPVIPTVPSKIDQAADLLRDLVAGLKEVPVKETLLAVNQTLASVDKLVNSPDLQSGLAGFSQTVQNFAQISSELQKVLPSMLDNVQDGSDELKAALTDMRMAAHSAKQALEAMDELVVEGKRSIGPQSELQYEVLQALQNVAQASKALQRTAETIEQQPQSLLFGKKR